MGSNVGESVVGGVVGEQIFSDPIGDDSEDEAVIGIVAEPGGVKVKHMLVCVIGTNDVIGDKVIRAVGRLVDEDVGHDAVGPSVFGCNVDDG